MTDKNRKLNEFNRAFPGDIYLLPYGMEQVSGVDRNSMSHIGIAINPDDLLCVIKSQLIRELEKLVKKIEKKKLNYIYQNSKTEWADGHDSGLQTAIAIIKESYDIMAL